MQRNNLKMCLRSIDEATDTSEVAKVCIVDFHFIVFSIPCSAVAKSFSPLIFSIQAYGGGGTKGSSSFIIRMDEYNCWLSGN